MHTTLRAVALTATIALTAGGLTTAQAHHSGSTSATRLTGGETTVALSNDAKSALSAAGITATPIAPATESSGTFTFPIGGGKIKNSTAFGFVALKGGVKLTKGDDTLKLRHLLIASGPRGAALFAVKRRHGFRHRFARASHFRHRHFGHRGRALKVLSLSDVQRNDANGNIVITANAALTERAAQLLNRKFDTTVFAAGQSVGTVTVSATH